MPSTTSWGREIAANITKHHKEISEAVLRNFPVFAMIESRGRMLYNQGGNGFDWRLEYKLPTVTGNTGETPRNFKRVNRHKICELEYRGAQVTDALTKKERLANQDSEARIIDIEQNIVKAMSKALKQYLAKEYYKDGEATGNEDSFHGIESFMGTSGTVDTSATAPSLASRTANAADLFANPSDTYANQSTALANFGGQQRTDIWPHGDCDEQADAHSPNILQYDSTHALLGSGTDFSDQGVESIRALRIACQRNDAGIEGEVDFGTLDRRLWNQLANQLDDKERVLVTAENGLRAHGFKTVVEVDGIEFVTDYGCPAHKGYLWNLDYMECLCMQDSMIGDESEYDIDSQQQKFVMDVLANLKFENIRCFGGLVRNADVG